MDHLAFQFYFNKYELYFSIKKNQGYVDFMRYKFNFNKNEIQFLDIKKTEYQKVHKFNKNELFLYKRNVGHQPIYKKNFIFKK